MSGLDWLSVGMLISAAIFVFSLLLYVSFRADRKNKEDYFFLLICLLNLFLLIGDIPEYCCQRNNSTLAAVLLRSGTFIRHFAVAPISMVFSNYLACYLCVELKRALRIRRSMLVMMGLYELIVFLNLTLHFLYKINPETNELELGVLWYLPLVIMVVPFFFDMWLFLKYKANVFKSAWIGTFLFILLPIAGSVMRGLWRIPMTYICISVGVFVLFFNIKSEQAYRFEKQRKELAESRISIMLSQIQPHFMYNSLTTIASLCEKDPSEAKRATMNFSRYLRHNVDSVNKRMPVPFTNELEHVQTYLELEKLRFGDRLIIEYDIKAKDFLIPPLTVQPLAENAVKHGICNKMTGQGTLKISTREIDDYYEIVIDDNGVGFDVTKKINDGREHIGMENVKERLMAMSDAKLFIRSTPGEGTIITIRIPKSAPTDRRKHANV